LDDLKEFGEGNPSLFSFLAFSCKIKQSFLNFSKGEHLIMTNEEAISYAVLALKNTGIDKKKIQQVASEMRWLFDMLTEEEAISLAEKFN
jgi:hypothetical protein